LAICENHRRIDGFAYRFVRRLRSWLDPLWPRRPCHFFLDEKVTKKSSHTGCFFAAQALCAAKPVKPRARSFCRLLSRKATASGKITNARATTQPNLFYRLSPEAARLTVFGQNQHFVIMNNEKSAKACQGARPGVLP
jgi:hypothetical protein